MRSSILPSPLTSPPQALPPGPRRSVSAVGAVACLCGIALLTPPASAPAQEPGTLRVETTVFTGDDKEPVARSLTLFRNGIAWDFLEPVVKPGGKGDGGGEKKTEFVLHDPARQRIVLVDPERSVKTHIDTLRLERLRASLGTWARKSDDKVMAWAGGPDFTSAIEEDSKSVTLVGPRVRYDVRFEPAPSADAAEEYSRFADAALLVKALIHPGGLPPFPRIAINRRVATAGGIPIAVTLEMESRVSKFGGRADVVRSEHKVLPSLLAGDHKRIASAEERLAVAESVDLATYAGALPAPPGAAGETAAPALR